jgi:hypothetical protein
MSLWSGVVVFADWGAAAPWTSSFGRDAAGLLVAVAEHPGDHQSRHLEDELAKCGGPAAEYWDLVIAKASFNGVGRHGLSAAAAGEEPAGILVGGSGQVETLVEVAK